MQLHRPKAKQIFLYQRGVYYVSVKIFNTLPASVTELVKDKKHFMSALKRCLIVEFLYSVNELLNYQHEIKIVGSSIKEAL